MKALALGFSALLASALFSTPANAFDNQQQDANVAQAPQATGEFPIGPVADMTPGALCDHPDSYRYPEHIPYCNRNVTSDLKREIIRTYDARFGFKIESMDRADFKIDHYIPLCAGGSNDISNLWPQHKSVYTITDPLEALICEKMAQGKLKQETAVQIMKQAKGNLSQVPDIISRVESL